MAGYSQSDLNTMRQDAIRRVQEMNRRSQNYVQSSAAEIRADQKPAPPQARTNQNTQQNNTQRVNQPSTQQNQQNQQNQHAHQPQQNYQQAGQFQNTGQQYNYRQTNQNNSNNQNTNHTASQTNQNTNQSFQQSQSYNPQQNWNNTNPLSMLFGGSRQNNEYRSGQNNQRYIPPEPKTEPPRQQDESPKNPLSGILDKFLPNLNIDSDKIVIILLIIILSREGADIKLLLALGYLLM